MPLTQLLLHVVVAGLCGIVVGLHFELRDRPGGVRTHMLATMGAAVFCSITFDVGALPGDGLRVVQGVASGVGFIGAATVLRYGGQIHGVANAASLWIAAAIGCKVGLGAMWTGLAVAGIVATFTLWTFFAERRWERRAEQAEREKHEEPSATPAQ